MRHTPTLNSIIAAATWIMETENREFYWEGSSLFFSKYNSSYGGEIYGIYLIIRFLIIMWPSGMYYSGLIRIKCDNLMGIKDCSYQELNIPKSKKVSITAKGNKEKYVEPKKRGLKFELSHIKGH